MSGRDGRNLPWTPVGWLASCRLQRRTIRAYERSSTVNDQHMASDVTAWSESRKRTALPMSQPVPSRLSTEVRARAVDRQCSSGRIVIRKAIRRWQVLPLFAKLSPCLVGIEACGTSHHWARDLSALGHDVRVMPPAYVKPYVKRSKTDAADAAAICGAVTRPTMRLVPVNTSRPRLRLSGADSRISKSLILCLQARFGEGQARWASRSRSLGWI